MYDLLFPITFGWLHWAFLVLLLFAAWFNFRWFDRGDATDRAITLGLQVIVVIIFWGVGAELPGETAPAEFSNRWLWWCLLFTLFGVFMAMSTWTARRRSRSKVRPKTG